jgi:neutral ceramidase
MNRTLLFTLLWAGCASTYTMPGTYTGAALPRSSRGPLWAGAAAADITPAPGPSTFGHGPDARTAIGFWTRLYCRAFYLDTRQPPEGSPSPTGLVLVSCDLPQMSTLLQREVAERVRQIVPTPRLMLAAIHTHAGPGHFFENERYGGMGSSRHPGFDDRMVAFLARQIAGAVEQARRSARPARLAWASGPPLWGLVRNRSLDAHQAGSADQGAPLELPAAQRAVDPRLDVLWLQGLDGGPIGALAFFAMHPTVLSNTNNVFGADTHGVAARVASARAGGLVAIFNTNEGDVAPVAAFADSDEALRLGELLGTRIAATRPGAGWLTEVALGASYGEFELRSAALNDGRRLCPHAELGVGAFRGGADHPTLLNPLLSSHEPRANPARADCQAPKVNGLALVESVIEKPSWAYPHHLPLAVVKLADKLLSFAPAELTVSAGHQVNDAVRAASGAADALTVSLANGYIQYVATRAEYEIQDYEGASTLYGVNSADYLAERFAALAVALERGGEPEKAEAFEYRPGPARHRLALPEDDPPLPPGKRVARFLCRIPHRQPPQLCFSWRDDGPGRVPLAAAPWIQLVGEDGQPVRRDALPLDDRGVDFVTRVWNPEQGGYVWSTLFRPGSDDWPALAGRGARIQVNGASPLRSAPVDGNVAECRAEQIVNVCQP